MQNHHLLQHGGNCCGIACLYLGDSIGPDTKHNFELKKFTPTDPNGTGASIGVFGADGRWTRIAVPPAYSEDRPIETYGERADAILKGFMSRPASIGLVASGIIEAALTSRQVGRWEPWLLERGFIKCVTARNSNSLNNVTVYLLPYGSHIKVHLAPVKE